MRKKLPKRIELIDSTPLQMPRRDAMAFLWMFLPRADRQPEKLTMSNWISQAKEWYKNRKASPVPFKEQNFVYTAPKSMEDEVQPLPAWRDKGMVISQWHVPFWMRVQILFTGRVWFGAMSYEHPPVWLQSEYPWEPSIAQRAAKKTGTEVVQ